MAITEIGRWAFAHQNDSPVADAACKEVQTSIALGGRTGHYVKITWIRMPIIIFSPQSGEALTLEQFSVLRTQPGKAGIESLIAEGRLAVLYDEVGRNTGYFAWGAESDLQAFVLMPGMLGSRPGMSLRSCVSRLFKLVPNKSF